MGVGVDSVEKVSGEDDHECMTDHAHETAIVGM